MIPYSTDASILANEKLSADIWRLTIQAPSLAAAARPGMFVMVRPGSGYDPLLRRPFSVHRVLRDGVLQLLYKVIGKGTRLLSSRRDGQTVNIIGPLGRGYCLSDDKGGRTGTCLIGGGLGAAPLCFLAERLREEGGADGEVVILLGARSAAELLAVADSFNQVEFKPFLATDDGSLGHHGYVAELLDQQLSTRRDWRVYACGPRPMLAAVARKCVERQWHCQVSLETVMACGIGACLGCAVETARAESAKYFHVCSDGPVFNAVELKW